MPPRRSTRARRNVAGRMNEGAGNQAPPPPAPLVPPPPPPPPQPQPRRYIETFINQKPPKFDGLGEPSTVETWIRALERIFEFMESTDQERLACVKFQLTGPADFWWDTKLKTMDPARREALTWEEFKEELNRKYVPMSHRRAKIEEFHTLKQGRMTVTEYDRALCELTRYVPELIDTDARMAEKFRAGLRHDIRAAVASRREITYAEVLSCALDVEEALPKEKPIVKAASPPQHKRKWEGDHAPYDGARQRIMRNSQRYGERQNMPYQGNNFRPRAPQCVHCLKSHFGECRERPRQCYTCNGNGHYARDCPNGRTGFGNRPTNQGFRPQPRLQQSDHRGYLPAPPQQQQQQQQPQQQQQLQQRRQGPPTQARAYALKGENPTIEQGSKEQEDMDKAN